MKHPARPIFPMHILYPIALLAQLATAVAAPHAFIATEHERIGDPIGDRIEKRATPARPPGDFGNGAVEQIGERRRNQ